ncbi:MAG: PH domain-containing protein [Candidatus Aenigmatarchaeota archaeon]
MSLPFHIPYIDIDFLLISLLASNSILLLIYVELRRNVENYSITESGITEETGFFDKHSTNIPLRMVEKCEIEENMIQRVLKFGDIIIDTGEDFFVMNGISKPGEKMDFINSHLEGMRANF